MHGTAWKVLQSFKIAGIFLLLFVLSYASVLACMSLLPAGLAMAGGVMGITQQSSVMDVVLWICVCLYATAWVFALSFLGIRHMWRWFFGKYPRGTGRE